ncbi:hypothetical protein PHYSODRAFT_342942 [Phytophthora sojae]|uniref:Uncharacterized protein n=1 Tax=Phytophthora sojae (strain P6497) TaxID=1094619 RepID=G5AHX2_PHYSP|nr:hypothetical protein PHYSODRAFT_342942 [Phytophthora sojae]EGZ04868.1 hypothetical protein PHYSODRAFT_342942 [Phytophthora sojae]|eukprot:XP_009539710.1 hypothetical protein PHYSODRAFT_342942 [Phytophthora sojae]
MWIPAGRVAAEHTLREVLASLDSDSQPQVWRDAKPHLRDFNTSPRNGISFVCTSDQVLQRLGGVELTICGQSVAIRRYSSYDKLYYVDLRRLPADTTDLAIYDWFVARGARPILITPSLGVGQLISRARTVYFNAVQCPDALFEPNGEPLREIYFTDGEKPCFVQHRLFRLNRVKPPSLRQSPRKASAVSDASMRGSDEAAAPPLDSSRVSPPLDPSGASLSQTYPTVASSSLDSSAVSSALDSSDVPSRTSSGRPRSQAAESQIHRVILGSVNARSDPEWKLVQHSQYGIVNRGGGKFIEPPGAMPCELSEDSSDPHALVYSIPVTPNTYRVLADEGFDESLPPDADLEAELVEDAGMTTPVSGFTADSALLPDEEFTRTLKSVRQMDLKVERVSVEELQLAIDEFLERDVLTYQTHEDVLAAIQAQPAYFRRIFCLPADRQHQLVKAHAVYRTICAEPTQEDESGAYLDRLRGRYDSIDSVDAAAFFERMFPGQPQQDAAFHSALCDLFLMVFAPGIYIDPIKVQAVLPDRSAPKRLRHAPFLLWSDLTLMYVARSDVCTLFMDDRRTPTMVVAALQHLKSVDIPSAAEAGPSRLVHPRL